MPGLDGTTVGVVRKMRMRNEMITRIVRLMPMKRRSFEMFRQLMSLGCAKGVIVRLKLDEKFLLVVLPHDVGLLDLRFIEGVAVRLIVKALVAATVVAHLVHLHGQPSDEVLGLRAVAHAQLLEVVWTGHL